MCLFPASGGVSCMTGEGGGQYVGKCTTTGTEGANIIARDLGLADKSELSGRDGGPMEHSVSVIERRIVRSNSGD